jgi:translocation and assembly module TamB
LGALRRERTGEALQKKHILRGILIGIPVLIAGLFVIALIVINTGAFRDFLRSQISEQALERLGARVEVGSITTHYTHLGADINNLVVYGTPDPAPNETPLLTAARLEIGVEFMPLLHGRFELREVILDRPVVHLRIDAQGRSNLPKSPHPSGKSNPNEVFDLEIADCAINSGEIFYNDAETPLDAELHDLKFSAGYSLLTSGYKGSFSYDNGRLTARDLATISHSMQVQFTATRSGLSLSPLILSTSASKVTLTARLTNYENPSISGNYEGNVSTQELAQILRDSSLPIGNVALNGKLAYQPTSTQPFLAALNTSGQVHSDKLEFRTGQRPFAATAISAGYNLSGANLQVQNLAADVLGGHARGNFSMERLDQKVSPSHLDAIVQGVSLTVASNTLAPPNVQRVPLEGTTNLNVNASWSGSIKDAVAHARLAVASAQQAATSRRIPVNGLVQVDYNGPQNRIAFGQSYLQTAKTKLSIAGTLSSQQGGNSTLTVLTTTSDLSETASLVTLVQSSMEPDGDPSHIPSLGGSASLTIRATGSTKDPRIQGQLSAQNLAVDTSKWRSLTLNLNADSSSVAISNGLLAGDNKAQISFSGKAGLQHWALEANSPVQLQASMTNMPVATAEQIANLQYPIEGILSANVTVNGTKSSPDGKATVTLAKGSAWDEPINNLAVNAQSHGGAIHSTVNLQIPAGTVAVDADYTLASQQYNLKVQANGIKLQQIAALQKRETVQGTADLSATGSGTIHDPQLAAKFTIPQLQAAGQTISNIDAEVNVANQHATLSLQSVVYQGSVQAKGEVALTGDHYTTATLDVRALPIAAVAANFLPSEGSELGGQTEIHLSASGPLKTPADMQAQLEIPTLNVTYGKAQLGLAKPLNATYRAGTLTINPTEIEGTGTHLTLGGTVPIKSAASYSLVADGTMDLNVLQQFAPDVKSSGQMEIHIHSAGRSAGMQGQFQIKDAVFATETIPVAIEGLNAQINLNGMRADIANFSGAAGGGQISARGYVAFGRESNFNLALNAQSVRLLYPTGLRSMLSGQINLNGNTASSALTGRVVINNLSLTQQFDLSAFAASFAGEAPGGSPSAFENGMKLGINVQSSQEINLSNSQLSLAGSANLNIVGTLADPVVLGRVALTDGDVFFLGKRFAIQSGTIEFANPVRTEPVLSMYITTTVEQYNLTLNLTGPVDKLRTNYTSDPALAPADIIHLLAFGNTNAEAAAEPSQSAAMGAESVLAQGAGSQVAGKLQSLTGISQISIDPLATNSNGDPGAQIAIQERVTGSLLFSFSTNVTTTQGQTVELQYELNKRMSVTVMRDQNGGYSIDLGWHKVF